MTKSGNQLIFRIVSLGSWTSHLGCYAR